MEILRIIRNSGLASKDAFSQRKRRGKVTTRAGTAQRSVEGMIWVILEDMLFAGNEERMPKTRCTGKEAAKVESKHQKLNLIESGHIYIYRYSWSHCDRSGRLSAHCTQMSTVTDPATSTPSEEAALVPQTQHKAARVIQEPNPHPEESDDEDDDVDHDAVDEDLLAGLPDDTTDIDLNHARLSSCSHLRLPRFISLRSLCLRQNFISSLDEADFGPLHHLEELDLYDNKIKSLGSALNDKPKLVTLDLSYNLFRAVPEELQHITTLKTIYLVQNKITKIEHLAALGASLTSLELGGNRIRKIENLDALVNLEELWLGKNKIAKLENLGSLIKLRRLSVQSNRIVKIEGLENLINLEEFYISHNGLKKIEGLTNNIKIKTIDISNNEIEALENLSHLNELSDLWASYNKVPDLKALQSQLGGIKTLETIYLEHNPCQTNDPTGYRRKIILSLPQVTQIDATYVRI